MTAPARTDDRCANCRRGGARVQRYAVTDGAADRHLVNGVEVEAFEVVACSARCAKAAVFGLGKPPRGSTCRPT